MDRVYAQIITAKNGAAIPVFTSNKAVHSKYDPQREGNTFAQSIKQPISFCIVIGLGGGYHVNSLLQNNPNCEFLIIEQNECDLALLRSIDMVQALEKHPQVHICTANEISHMLKECYIPARYGDLQIVTLATWAYECPEYTKQIQDTITDVLKEISADYSVQSHFGNIWQRNILSNLRLCEKITPFVPINEQVKGKKAIVIAAGPTLDAQIATLKQYRDNYYLLATDTAFDALMQQQIIPDVVVSIDGQMISHCHYMGSLAKQTLFVFDITANTAAVRHIYEQGCKLFFVTSGHPLVSYAEQVTGFKFMHIHAGSGTVTIAAADFAHQIGCTDISCIGADFSYPNGKPYCKGSYLDTLYSQNSSKIVTTEEQFIHLMYRTPLIDAKTRPGVKTTEVLDSYRKTFELWLQNSSHSPHPYTLCELKFSWERFKRQLTQDAQSNTLNFGLLPYIAYLRKTKRKDSNEQSFFELLKLAYSNAMRYTKLL
ncbi:MAG: DUF115 domain-containing protein [Treponema sp.]|nr:DUF115 domain-containing protein [Treponema sp.]